MFVYPIEEKIYKSFFKTANLFYSGMLSILSTGEAASLGEGLLLEANLKTRINPKNNF
jgi:hypothetical protein